MIKKVVAKKKSFSSWLLPTLNNEDGFLLVTVAKYFEGDIISTYNGILENILIEK